MQEQNRANIIPNNTQPQIPNTTECTPIINDQPTNLKTQTAHLNPKTQNLKPKPQTLNPTPQIPFPNLPHSIRQSWRATPSAARAVVVTLPLEQSHDGLLPKVQRNVVRSFAHSAQRG
jgi:hypothetical protein